MREKPTVLYYTQTKQLDLFAAEIDRTRLLYDDHHHELREWRGQVTLYHDGKAEGELTPQQVTDMLHQFEQRKNFGEKTLNLFRQLVGKPVHYTMPSDVLGNLCPQQAQPELPRTQIAQDAKPLGRG